MVANDDGRSATAPSDRHEQLRKRHKKPLLTRAQTPEKEEPTRVIEMPGDPTDVHNYTPLAKTTFSLLPYSTLGWLCTTLYSAFVQTTIIRSQARGSGWSQELYSRQFLLLLDLLCTAPTYAKALGDALAIFRGKWRPRLRVIGTSVPAVDIAIVCCKEPLPIILDTVRAVLSIDYPDAAFRLLISDDGAQDEVRAGVAELAAEFPNRALFYTARRRTPATSHKAGNLNHALAFFASLPRGETGEGAPAPFFAGIDADMIVEKKWLRAQMGYLILDPALAFTCPPPRFYNVPIDDPLSQSLLIFQRYEEIVKDRAGFPWCTGSGWVMRRRALEGVGGFPDGSLTEDLLLSNLILGKGWKAAYAMETLQWGLVPDSYHAHVQQRKRWAVGASQAGLLMRFCLTGTKSRFMTPFQRVFGFFYPMQNVTSSLVVLGIFGSLVALLCGISGAQYSNDEELKLLIRLSCVTYLFYFARMCQVSVIAGVADTFRELVGSHFLILYFAYDHWKTFLLPQWLGGRPEPFSARFVATGSLVDDLNEWNASTRAPLLRRLKSVLLKDAGIFSVLVGFAHIVGVGLNVWRASALHEPNTRDFYLYLLTRIFWIPLAWPLHIAAFLRPLQYTLFPPSVPDREELLVRDEKGVAYPKASARSPKFTQLGLGMELFWFLQAGYAVLLLVGTLYW